MTQAITIGCDPEFFVKPIVIDGPKVPEPTSATAAKYIKKVIGENPHYNASPFAMTDADNDILVPICGKLGGTKKEPKQFGKILGFAYQEDGAAVEFNIPPATTVKEFSESVTNMITGLRRILAGIGLQPSQKRSILLPASWVKEFPRLTQIGCDPDFSSYNTPAGNPPPRLNLEQVVGTRRGAGGHIHIGYPKDLCPPDVLVRLMDLFVYSPLLKFDKQGYRRQFWGLAGLYRPKDYGVEYRTMSNFWLWDAAAMRAVASRTFALMNSLKKNLVQWQALYNAVDWQSLQLCIYQENHDGALDHYNRAVARNSIMAEADKLALEVE